MMRRLVLATLVLLATLILLAGSCSSKSAADPAGNSELAPLPPIIPARPEGWAPRGSVVLLAAGDIQGGPWSPAARFEKTAQLLDRTPHDFVVGLGDMSNNTGSVADYAAFERAWGRHKSKLFCIPGSHDYGSKSRGLRGGPFYDYFNSPASTTSAPAPGCHTGPRGRGYFAVDLGSWLLIGLNTYVTLAERIFEGDEQMQWLAEVMRAKPRGKPVIVIAHTPRYTKATVNPENKTRISIAWDILLRYRPDVRLFLAGHMNGIYERWMPMDNERRPIKDGIRSFTVATGGMVPYAAGSPDALLEKTAKTQGVLKLTLRPNGYDWSFLPVAGESFADVGTVGF